MLSVESDSELSLIRCTHPSAAFDAAFGAVFTMLQAVLSLILRFTRLNWGWLRRRPRPLSCRDSVCEARI
jgi:hypothetical protein